MVLVMSRGTSDRGERRRRQIIDAALECFCERGIAGTTLEGIRKASGASTGSIYHLFASKEEIAGAAYLDGIRGYQEGLLAEMAEWMDPGEAIRGVVRHYLRWVEAHPRLARFILHTRRADLLPAIRDEVWSANRTFFRTLRRRLEPHVVSGEVRAIAWELLVPVVMGPSLEYARLWLAGVSRVPPAEAADALAEAAWRAVRGEGTGSSPPTD